MMRRRRTTRQAHRPLHALTLTLTALFVCLAPRATQAQSGSARVTIDSGALEGTVANDVAAFKGIPYAAPPVGDLRWRPPQPVASWPGVRPATAYGHDCIQVPVEGDAAPIGSDLSEDCLYVNVWRPAGAAASDRLPVLVWIHGGGFVNGGASAAVFDGTALAREGIIVVSFNYRLGRFGFFSHPALVAEQATTGANYAYMDQDRALEWVHRNIAAFGGDPAAVTIAGESAGGQSVMDLLVQRPSRDLYQRAIVMSGGGRRFLGEFPLTGSDRRNPSAEDIGLTFAKSVGIGGTDAEALAKLRALPAKDIVGRANMLALLATAVLPLGPIQYARGPIIDGKTTIDTAGALVERGHVARVPLMIGTTTQDLGVWLPTSKDKAFKWFGADRERAREFYDPDDGLKPLAVGALVGADYTMQEPARFVARKVAEAGEPVWLYRFGYVAESARAGGAGAGHASEVPYFFDTVRARYGDATTPADESAARAFSGYVVNFVKHGDPNGDSLPLWTRVDPSRSDLLQFTSDGPAMTADPWKERLDLVERAATTQPAPVTVAELGRSDWSGFMALGVVSVPTYLGSDESTVVPIPLIDIEYRQRVFASVGTTGLVGAVGFYPVRRPNWQVTAQVGAAERRLDDDALAGLDDHKFGSSVGGTIRHGNALFNQTATIMQGITSGAGLTARLGVGVGVPLGLKGVISLGGSALLADAQQMRYDFGIDAAEASRRQPLIGIDPRLRSTAADVFTPGGGLQSVGGTVAALVLLPKRMLFAVVGSVTTLSDHAMESPLVTARTRWTIGAGLGFRL